MTTEPEIADFEEDNSGPTDTQLRVVTSSVKRALYLEVTLIPQAQGSLQQLQIEYKNLVEQTIPNAMKEASLKSFDYADGEIERKVEIDEAVRSSITEANKPAAHAWLESHKHGDLIKRTITISFGRDQVKLFKKWVRDMAQRKEPIPYEVKEAVHASTLGAFVREQRRDYADADRNPDEAVPLDLFSIFKQTCVVFKLPKKKKVV